MVGLAGPSQPGVGLGMALALSASVEGRFSLFDHRIKRIRKRAGTRGWGTLVAVGLVFSVSLWDVLDAGGQTQRGAARELKELRAPQGDEVGLMRNPALADYALYHRALTHLEAKRTREGERALRELVREYPQALMSRTAALLAADLARERGDSSQAIEDLRPWVARGDGAALLQTAEFWRERNRPDEAIRLLRRLYFESPQEMEAERAPGLLQSLGVSEIAEGRLSAGLWRRRAEKLEEAGLWLIAGRAYQELGRRLSVETSDEVWLRAGINLYRGEAFAEAVEILSRVEAGAGAERGKALYFLGKSQLASGDEAGTVATLGRLRQAESGSSLSGNPNHRRTGDLLLALGRFHEARNRKEEATAYYQQVVRQYPKAEGAHQAHFFLAWRAHEAGEDRTAADLLTDHLARYGQVTDHRGRAAFWAALHHERHGDKSRALTLYRGLLTRYGASWFGHNAERRIAELNREGVKTVSLQSESPLAQAVRALQSIRIIPDSLRPEQRDRVARAEQLRRLQYARWARDELEAARQDAPNSPLLNLRLAQLQRDAGENAAAIEVLKRGYPDYGQSLPDEMPREAWQIFYPLAWWSQIQAESRRHGLDPYLVAGLIRQETVFNPRARSRANALGLMQILPSTGQSVARKNRLGGGRLSRTDFFDPVLNLQLGTAYLGELSERFSRFEYIAAAYNGGPTRVARWVGANPTLEIEDWVEQIPLRETRLYVQGVYRNARHYQRLYDEKGQFRLSVPH